MISEIHELANNPAFWTFLGIFVTSFFGYKQVLKKSPAGKLKTQARNATSFEELRSVVEVLQSELVKKDRRHKDDTDYILSQLREAREEVATLTHKLADAISQNGIYHNEIAQLKRNLGVGNNE